MTKLVAVVALPIVLLLGLVVAYSASRFHKETADQKRLHLAQAANDLVIKGHTDAGEMILHAVEREAHACDRLHLPKAERARRIEAVHQAGMKEWRRVAASRYTIPFQEPPTD